MKAVPYARTGARPDLMALEDGVSIFFVMSDEPAVLERFVAEVIPDVHEQVSRERKSTRMPAVARRRSDTADPR
jgi:hypothetical protein